MSEAPVSAVHQRESCEHDYCHRTSLLQAHVVSAFEQSLANMTSRLSQLTLTAEEKVTETPHIRNLVKLYTRTGNFRSFVKLSRICGDKEPECILVSNSLMRSETASTEPCIRTSTEPCGEGEHERNLGLR